MSMQQWDLCRSKAKIHELTGLLSGVGKRKILILCHNNPDPDSIASAYGLSFLFNKKFGVRSVLGYGGVVTRAENRAMIQRLHIKMRQLTRVDPSLYYSIALIDGQPGSGNNLFEGRDQAPMIVIDHHPLRKLTLKAEFHDVRPKYGATSTIVTEYLVAADVKPSRSVANALLYGIKTDTNALVRGACRIDFNAFNYLSPLTNPRVLGWIEKPALSQEYFVEHYRGLSHTILYRDVAVSYLGKIGSGAIIPELAYLLLRMENVCWSLCMGETNNLLILSLRTTTRKYRAGNVLRRLIGRSGSAGGHKDLAGGQIPLSPLTESERHDLPRRLINRFLKIIDRQGATPKMLVERVTNET